MMTGFMQLICLLRDDLPMLFKYIEEEVLGFAQRLLLDPRLVTVSLLLAIVFFFFLLTPFGTLEVVIRHTNAEELEAEIFFASLISMLAI